MELTRSLRDSWIPPLLCLALCVGAPVRAQEAAKPSQEVSGLLEQSMEAKLKAHIDEARKLAAQALQQSHEKHDRPGEASSLLMLGRLLLSSNPKSALEYIEQANQKYRDLGDRNGQAQVWLSRGGFYHHTSEFSRAKECYESALPLFRATKDISGEANTLVNLSMIGIETGHMKEALPNLNTALSLHQKAKDQVNEVRDLLTLGVAYAQIDEIDAARDRLGQAERLAHQLGLPKAEADALYNLGVMQIKQGYVRQAAEAVNKALPLYEAGSQIYDIANCHASLGQIAAQNGALFEALAEYDKAMTRYVQIGDALNIARTQGDIGTVSAEIGQSGEALELYTQALKGIRSIGDQNTEAQLLQNTGELYDRLGKSKQARAYLERAIQLDHTLGILRGEAYGHVSLGAVLLEAGDTEQAAMQCDQALTLFHKMNDALGETTTLCEQGQIRAATGQTVQALERYHEALKLAQQIGDVAHEAQALGAIATIHESQGQTGSAEQEYRQALTRTETMRANLGDLTDAKIGLQESQSDLYHHYLRFLLNTKQETQAFQWTQSAKARGLSDLMASSKTNFQAALTSAERTAEENLQQRGRKANRQWLAVVTEWAGLRGQKNFPDAQRQKAQQRLQDVREQQQQIERDWNAFTEQVAVRNPRLVSQRATQSATLEETAASLPENGALLEYLFLKVPQGKATEESLALLVVTRQQGKPHLNVYRLAAGSGQLASLTRDFRAACAGRPGSAEERPYQEMARQLYRRLLLPAMPALAGKTRLIVCPDGPLWDVPFQALMVSAAASTGKTLSAPSAFLWERYHLSYAYSATEWKVAQTTRPHFVTPPRTLLVMADPDFGATSTRENSSHPTNLLQQGRLTSLPNTRQEAEAIHASFPSATLKLGEDAQESIFKQIAGQYRYLHLATHGFFNDAAPMMSGIVLANPKPGEHEDGFLTAREIFDLPLNAEMVVLSACETARGTQRSGEGLIGLTWALFAAGVKTQVVSQWSVDDTATQLLMKGFYMDLHRGQNKEDALRASALALLHDGQYRHPFYWASFILMGDWR